MERKQIVVIGGGPAGLTAAYELVKRGYGVTLLEQSDTFGGISRTVQVQGHRMDIGGHRFFSKDARIVQWWQQFLPMQGAPALDDGLLQRAVPLVAGGPDPEKEDRVMLSRTRVSRIYYGGNFYDYPISLKWQTLKNMGVRTTLQVGFSFLAATLHKRKEHNLEDYYINCFGKKLYRMFFEGYTEKLWGRHPREIDAGWGRQRTKGLSLFGILQDMLGKLFLPKKIRARHVQTSLIETFRYPKLGPGQLWETVAAEIAALGGQICCNSTVTRLETQQGRVTAVYVRDAAGEKRLCADAVFSSMPLNALVAGLGEVPAEIAQIAAGLPYRDFVTVGLLVDKLMLENRTQMKTLGNIVPDCWIYVQDPGVKLGRIQIFNNWSPYLLRDPQQQVWVGLEYFCREGDAFWNMAEQDCCEFAAQELCALGILRDPKAVHMAHRERVQKAYPAYFDTYENIDRLIDYLNGFDNLFCIGRNGQHRYNNMDHSMATALEAVALYEQGNCDKTRLWQVNTEQEYHEQART